MGRRQKYGDEVNPRILELYNNNISLSKIGKELGIHPQVIKRKLIKMGVEIRGISEAMVVHHKVRKGNKECQ